MEVVRKKEAESYLALDDVALLEDLDDHVLVLGGAKVSLKSALRGGVEGTLVAVSTQVCQLKCPNHRQPCVLASKNLNGGELTRG